MIKSTFIIHKEKCKKITIATRRYSQKLDFWESYPIRNGFIWSAATMSRYMPIRLDLEKNGKHFVAAKGLKLKYPKNIFRPLSLTQPSHARQHPCLHSRCLILSSWNWSTSYSNFTLINMTSFLVMWRPNQLTVKVLKEHYILE